MLNARLMLLPCLLTSACAKAPVDLSDVPEEALAYCVYTNRFSQLEECREYLGEAWTTESAEDDCASQEGTAFGEGGCPYDEALGRCVLNAGDDDVYRIVFPGSDEEQCASLQRGCELFGGGAFVADTPCGGLPPSSGGGSGGLPVFQPAELMCQEPLAGEPAGSAEGGQVCTWSAISACTEEGRKFADYASCETVLTQRPYWPAPAGGEAAPADDPRHDDVEYQEELAWVKGQIESCACTCCHSSEVAPDGPSNWYVEAGPFFVDSFYESGLALGAGFIDSASFGAYAPEDNNGFARTLSGFPSTDPPRMKAFFERALADRGYTAEDFADETPFGGPLYTQSIYEPSACTRGEGVTAEGDLVWTGGGARYVYVLEEGAANPGPPPNLDLPDGTVWRVDVPPSADPMESPLKFGALPASATQRFPAAGVAPDALVSGRTYYVYAMADVAIPITRCLFVAP